LRPRIHETEPKAIVLEAGIAPNDHDGVAVDAEKVIRAEIAIVAVRGNAVAMVASALLPRAVLGLPVMRAAALPGTLLLACLLALLLLWLRPGLLGTTLPAFGLLLPLLNRLPLGLPLLLLPLLSRLPLSLPLLLLPLLNLRFPNLPLLLSRLSLRLPSLLLSLLALLLFALLLFRLSRLFLAILLLVLLVLVRSSRSRKSHEQK